MRKEKLIKKMNRTLVHEGSYNIINSDNSSIVILFYKSVEIR
jgi:hypothetical protein